MGGNVFGFGGDRRFFGVDENSGQLRGGEHLLRSLLQAKGEELLGGLNGGAQDTGMLQQLADSFGRAGGMSTGQLAQLLRNGGIPAALNMPRPDSGQCACSGQYAAPQGFDFANQDSSLGRFLRDNPHERQQLEMALGGRIRPSEANNGRLSIVPFSAGAFPSGGRENVAAFNAQAMLSDMSRAAGGSNGTAPFSANTFQGMVLGALQQMASQQQGGANPEGFSSLRSRGTNPFVDWNEDSPNQARRRAMFGLGGGQGAGAGNGMGIGGGDGMGNGGEGMGMDRSAMQSGGDSRCGSSGCGDSGGGDDISSMLASGGLTIEDKITLMIMMIMKKMDQDIEKQANHINALQQQQQAGGGAGGKGGGGAGGGAPSIDVETMKLKRLIDKRSQMFDMLRQIIDKYNQTAKGIIDSMGR